MLRSLMTAFISSHYHNTSQSYTKTKRDHELDFRKHVKSPHSTCTFHNRPLPAVCQVNSSESSESHTHYSYENNAYSTLVEKQPACSRSPPEKAPARRERQQQPMCSGAPPQPAPTKDMFRVSDFNVNRYAEHKHHHIGKSERLEYYGLGPIKNRPMEEGYDPVGLLSLLCKRVFINLVQKTSKK